jgi:hypothetical protein
MPAKKAKIKVTARRPAARATEEPDPLRCKLHDLANSLEAISLARQFIPRGPHSLAALETLATALQDARKALHQMNADLRGAPRAKRQTAAR